MKVFTTIAELRQQLDSDRNAGKTIGLVPTMGALHNGHLQLVKTSVANNDVTVVSIFVNPTQFNDKNDLQLYPRTLDKDCQLLESVGCTYAFAPSVEEMYPTEDTRVFNLGPVAEVMEGKYRPGHFNGVAQIVSKLFDIVRPDNAYFGDSKNESHNTQQAANPYMPPAPAAPGGGERRVARHPRRRECSKIQKNDTGAVRRLLLGC